MRDVKKILFVSLTDPRETSYGGQQRTHVIWRGLQSVGEVWTVVPVPHMRMESRDEKSRVYKICLERRYSAGWFVQRLLFRLFPRVAFPLALETGALSSIVPTPDVCVARTLWVAARLGLWNMADLFVDVDDTPTVDFALAYPHKRFKTWLLQKWQNWVCAKAKGLWVPDPDQIRGLLPFVATHLPNIPIGNISLVSRNVVDPNRLLFLGYLAHRPNVVAIDWFLESFWAELKKNFTDLKLDVIGGGLSAAYRARWSQYRDVFIHGFVQDVVPFFEHALALITPMRIGSGTCIKVLESLARGVPVVSTSQGLRGVPESDRKPENGIFQFTNVRDLIEILQGLQSSTGDARRVIAYLEKQYSQERINEVLRRELK